MGLVLATRKPPLTDTFQMALRHVLWPQLATGSNGTWGWGGSTARMFGGVYYNLSNAQNDYIEFDDVVLQPGTYKIQALVETSTTLGIVHVSFGGSDTGARLDCYSGSTLRNQLISDAFAVSTKTRGPLRLTVASKNASSSGYYFFPQQIEIVKTSAESDAGTSLDDLPWVVDVPPYMYSAGSVTPALLQSIGYVFGSAMSTGGTQNTYLEWDVWLPQGTHDFQIMHQTGTVFGIGTVAIDGSTVGTFDAYGGWANNVISTISGIAVASTGVHKLRVTMATKHASSTSYGLIPQWIQFRKTAETGAITPTGATYGRETLELWPWFADTSVGFNTFLITGSQAHYGWLGTNPPHGAGQSLSFVTGLLAGHYLWEELGVRSTDQGIGHISQNGGSDLATIDRYGSTVYSLRFEASISLDAGGELTKSIDSKNAAASLHANHNTMIRLTRTGA